ncbi:MAG: NAD-binding protein [Gemmatimonadota bacterium]|nr:NAD-binding protein [Gemmatimonadota bacterium]
MTTPERGHRGELARIRRRLIIAVAALAVVTGAGVLGYSILGGPDYTLVDAVYMTLITLTTVGYSEVIDLSGNPAGRVFTIFLLLGGLGVVLYTVPLIGAFVVEGELFNAFARRKMDQAIAGMAGHFIVCGDSAVAGYVAQELGQTSRPVVLVRQDQEGTHESADQLTRIPYVLGDPTDDEILIEAGVAKADGVVAAMENEKDNILVVLTARRLSPSARIVAATEKIATEPKLKTAGADAVVSPSRIGGLRMASELVRPQVVTFLDKMVRDESFGLRVEEVQVSGETEAVGKSLVDLGIADVQGAILLAIRDGESGDYQFRPPLETTLKAGMTLVVMADVEGRRVLEAMLRA